MSAGGMPELGSKISLISKADIRYEGRLFTVDPQECTIALANVRSFGTEERETPFPILPQTTVYDYILFRGSDIKDIRVVNNVAIPNDPAIMQMHLPTNQMPPQQNFPPPNYPMQQSSAGAQPQQMNAFGPFGQMQQQSGNMGPSMGVPITQQSSTAQATIQQQHQQSQSGNSLAPGSGSGQTVKSNSRSGTPMNLSRKSPTSDMAVQTGQSQNQNNQSASSSNNKENQKIPRNQRNNNQRERRDSGRIERNNEVQEQHKGGYRNQNQQHRPNNNQHHQMQNQQQQQHRGYNNNNNRNNNNINNQMRGNQGGSARMRGPPGQNYRPQNNQNQGTPNQNNKPLNANGPQPRTGGNKQNTLKFENEFDFEQANSKFEELRSELAKLKVGSEETKNSDQMNGEVEKKDDSGNETGADHENENGDETGPGYDKTKSFFDNISCEAVERSKGKTQRTDWRQERKLNTETFGSTMHRRANHYRGRGGYYMRNNYNRDAGQYNRGGYRPINRRNPNNSGGRNNVQNNQQGGQQQSQQQPATVAAAN